MKNLILGLSLLVVLSLSAQETKKENWKINSLSISTGETPLTKGITLTPEFSKGKSVLLMDFNAELGEAMYFYSPKKWFAICPSVGFFKNTIWVGPIGSLNLFNGHIKTLNWVGYSAGNPEESSTKSEANFLFSYQWITVAVKGIEVYYVLQHYQRCLEHISGVKATFNLSHEIKLFGGLGYMFNAEKYLWSTGFVWNFSKQTNLIPEMDGL